MSGLRLGVEIACDAVRAVAVRRGRVTWAASTSRHPGLALEEAIEEVVGAFPAPRWPKPGVVVAVGPMRCQTRRVEGLPSGIDTRAASAIVRQNVSRFFLRNGVPVVPGALTRSADGSWWGVAFEQPVVDAACAVARRRRWRVVMVPSVGVLWFGSESATWVMQDGSMCVEATYRAGALADVRRVSAGVAHANAVPDVLAQVGPDASALLAAYGAATVQLSSVPALIPGHPANHVPAWRLTASMASLVAATVLTASAPTIGAVLAARRAEARLAARREAGTIALAEQAELARYRAALTAMGRFAGRTPQRTQILAELSRLLPDSSVVLTIRLDSSSGQMVVLTPRAAGLLERLEHSAVISTPQLVGPVIREILAGRRLERVSVRFRT